jgi:hypothetical protein
LNGHEDNTEPFKYSLPTFAADASIEKIVGTAKLR